MNRVKELRLKAGMEQKELAALLGVKQPSISRWECQKADPMDENIDKLSEIFKVPPHELIYYGRPESQWAPDIDSLARKVKEIISDNSSQQLSGVRFALMGEVEDLTDDEVSDVLEFARFKKSQRK